MFSFFTKKDFLVDYLEGVVDIHNHILPGIDDGAKNAEESVELIRAFGEFGVTNFICTPHIMNGYYENNPKTIKDSYQELSKKLIEERINVHVDFAAEHMIDDNFENILEDNQVMLLGENHLLIEMSYLQPSLNFDVSVKKIQERQIFPVLAHPERYAYLHKDLSKYKYYKSAGIKFQLNLLSIAGYYGNEIKKTALKLLEQNMYDFVGSDVHHSNHLKFLKQSKIKSKSHDILKSAINKYHTYLQT